jgi:transcription elongation GreA/GreB family factor
MTVHSQAWWFMPSDLEALQAEIERLLDQIRETKKDAGEGANQSSETWHDNFAFEEAQRQLRMLLNQLAGLSRMLERAEAPPAVQPDVVGVGSRVKFSFVSHDGAPRFHDVDEVVVGSHMVFSEMRDLGCISHSSPLGSTLLGMRTGEARDARIGERTGVLSVLSVSAANLAG